MLIIIKVLRKTKAIEMGTAIDAGIGCLGQHWKQNLW